jgi:trigger factor
MNISKENLSDLNTLLRIRLTPADYQKDVESAIKKFSKTATMPGFRPGHVPAGMVRKMHGKSFLAEELNKIVSKTVNEYIVENKLAVLGDPLPRNNEAHDNDFEKQGDFEFLFELGLAPEINMSLPLSHKVKYYEIEVDEKRIQDYSNDSRRRYGKFSNPETSDEKCILYGELTELNADGTEKEGGIKNTSTISIELVKDADAKKKLLGIKKDDVVTINPLTAMKDATEVAYMLKIEKEDAEKLTSDFSYKIVSVNHVERAELNQEFFDKVYGPDTVKTEEEFYAKVKSDIEAMFANESRHKFNHDLEDVLLHEIKFELPDEFLKRWIKTVNEKPITDEQISNEYPSYSREMKLKLIEQKVATENNIEVTKDDLNGYARQLILQQFSGYGQGLTEELINDFAKRYLEKEENIRKATEQIASQKATEIIANNTTKDIVKVSYDEFRKIVKEHTH